MVSSLARKCWEPAWGWRKITALFAIIAAVFALHPAMAAPLKIRMHYAVTPGTWALLMTKFPHSVVTHYGKSYVIDPIFMRGSGPAMQALAAGEEDVSGLSPQAIANLIERVHLPIKIIGNQLSVGVPGYASSDYWVRTNSGIKKVEQLKGKVVAVNALGSAIGAAARLMLLRHGLDAGRDYQLIELRFSAQLPALKQGRVDCAFLASAWAGLARKDPTLKPLFSMRQAIGRLETSSFVVRTDWLKAHRAAVVDLMEDLIRARRWAASKKGHYEAVKITAEVTKRPVKSLMYAYTHKDSYYDPNGMVDVKALQHNINDMAELKIIDKSFDVSKYVDMSIAKDAVARIDEGK